MQLLTPILNLIPDGSSKAGTDAASSSCSKDNLGTGTEACDDTEIWWLQIIGAAGGPRSRQAVKRGIREFVKSKYFISFSSPRGDRTPHRSFSQESDMVGHVCLKDGKEKL